MSQADVKHSVESIPIAGERKMEQPQPQYPQQEEYAYPTEGTESMQALVETIIEEKWQELVANVSKIVEWKDNAEQRLVVMEEKMKSIKEDMDRLHSSILERVGEYDKTMTDVGTELKALEKVFQKVLPGFVENVAELSRITKDLKGKK